MASMPWSLNVGTGKGSQIIIEHCTYVCIDASVASFSLSPTNGGINAVQVQMTGLLGRKKRRRMSPYPSPGPHQGLGDAHHACVSVSFNSRCPCKQACLVTRLWLRTVSSQRKVGATHWVVEDIRALCTCSTACLQVLSIWLQVYCTSTIPVL